jgi:hypothetical protein
MRPDLAKVSFCWWCHLPHTSHCLFIDIVGVGNFFIHWILYESFLFTRFIVIHSYAIFQTIYNFNYQSTENSILPLFAHKDPALQLPNTQGCHHLYSREYQFEIINHFQFPVPVLAFQSQCPDLEITTSVNSPILRSITHYLELRAPSKVTLNWFFVMFIVLHDGAQRVSHITCLGLFSWGKRYSRTIFIVGHVVF